MKLPSKHRNSSPGGMRSSTLPLGHGVRWDKSMICSTHCSWLARLHRLDNHPDGHTSTLLEYNYSLTYTGTCHPHRDHILHEKYKTTYQIHWRMSPSYRIKCLNNNAINKAFRNKKQLKEMDMQQCTPSKRRHETIYMIYVTRHIINITIAWVSTAMW